MKTMYLSNDKQKEMLRAGELISVSYIKDKICCVELVKSELTLDEIKNQYEKMSNVRVCGVNVASMDYYRPCCFGRVITEI